MPWNRPILNGRWRPHAWQPSISNLSVKTAGLLMMLPSESSAGLVADGSFARRLSLLSLLVFDLPAEPPKLLIPLITALLLALVFLTVPPAAPDLDADPAWCGVLTYAHQHHLQFGTQIVFTFGPFGFLIAPYFFGQPTGLLISVNLVLSFIIAFGLCLLAWRLNRWWRCVTIAAFVILMGILDPRADVAFAIGFSSWAFLCFRATGRRF